MVKFSIVTVCLNSGKTIKRCLDSVSNQTYKDFEHIIIDGLSIDNTLQAVKDYKVSICISEPDSGIYDAMNKGINLANGEYVLFLNSDDELLPDFLLESNKLLDGQDFLSSSINMCFEKENKKWKTKPINKTDFIWRMPIPHAGLIVKRDVINSIGSLDLNFKITSDFDFVIKLLKKKYIGVYNNNCLFNFYMGGVSQNYLVVKENHKVRLKHFDNPLLIYLAYFLDNLRYLKKYIHSISQTIWKI